MSAPTLTDEQWEQLKADVGATAADVEPEPTEVPIGRSARELRDETADEIPWLVPGMIAPGWTTEINGREKHGKGTLVAYLIGALERGEPTVFGDAPDKPVTTLIYTEEPKESIAEKLDAFNVEHATIVYGWELRGLDWQHRYERLVREAKRRGHGVLFVDNISRATGADDEAGTELARKVEPLSELAKETGIALLYDRHQRKSGGRIEDLSRGGTALGGAVEAIVTMKPRSAQWDDRARTLYSRGRVRATTWEKTIELSADGTDYTLGSGADFRTRIVREPGVGHVWTVDAFATAIGKSTDTAGRWLRDSPVVQEIERGEKNARQFRVLPEAVAPTLD